MFFLLRGTVHGAIPEKNSKTICEGVHFKGASSVSFSGPELRLLCGDPESHSWQKIAPLQAKYFAETFLQARGYLNPQFEIKEQNLFINPGEMVRLQRVEWRQAPAGFDGGQKRKILGTPLTPRLLDELESWAKTRAQELGHACVKVKVTARPREGVVDVDFSPGPVLYFGKIGNSGLVTEVGLVERSHAFLSGQRFDPRLLQLSSQRLQNNELYVSSYFDWTCSADPESDFAVQRHLVSATPRLLTFGVGVDTEVGPTVRGSFRHALLTKKGTQSQIQVTASYREQKLEAQLFYYPSSKLSSRFQWVPRFQLKREKETQYESITTSLGIAPGYGFESTGAEHRLSWGPNLDQIYMQDAQTGPSRSSIVSLNFTGSSKSHLFEYYAAEPRSGWFISANVNSRLKGVSSLTNSHRLQVDAQILWNVRAYDPPLLVVGSRTRLGTFLFGDTVAGLTDTPVSQRFFLGGDNDLRGFSRKQLPFDENGFVSAISQSFEFRWVEILPWKLQPFLLFDIGAGGPAPWQLDRQIYVSPGFGLRWSSPLGPVRTSLARGQVLRTPGGVNPPAAWQWFVSFGREF